MPNGGSDNCSNCRHNHLRQSPRNRNVDIDRMKRMYCVLRGVNISNILYTYCANFFSDSDVPEGPIFSAGIDSNIRLPWNNKYEPKFGISGICKICNREFDKGISVKDDHYPIS